LICTFGKNPQRVFNAIRLHKYDQLILITEQGAKASKEYKEILSFEKINPNQPEVLKVKPNDFWSCYNTVNKILLRYPAIDCILNISGGTKLLSMASMLCAFNYGVSAYQFEENRLVKLPVFKNFSVKDRLGNTEIKVLSKIKNNMSWDELNTTLEDKTQFNSYAIRSFKRLEREGLVECKVIGDDLRVFLTTTGASFKKLLEVDV
jgi:hypothetical protein